MSVDPDIAARWIRGWTMARNLPWPVRDGAAWRVDVNWPDQKARYVFDRMSDEVAERAQTISEPFVFLKVFEGEGAVRPRLSKAWTYPSPGFFMRSEQPSKARLPLPPGYSLSVRTERQAVRGAFVHDISGAEVASGHISWEDGYAVYNRIVTDPAHQRLGLASQVMAALGEAAREQGGARHHILMATVTGRQLYESLGWALHSEYTTAVLPEPAG